MSNACGAVVAPAPSVLIVPMPACAPPGARVYDKDSAGALPPHSTLRIAAAFAIEGRGCGDVPLGVAAQIRAEIGTPQALPEQNATAQAVAGVRAAFGEGSWAAAFREEQSLLPRLMTVEVDD